MIRCWLQDAHERVFWDTARAAGRLGRLDAARGETLAFQVVIANPDDKVWRVGATIEPPAGLKARIRRVGYVPVPHHNTDVPLDERDGVGHIPGYVPDPLFDEQELRVAPRETAAFWITVEVAKDCRPGARRLPVTVRDLDSKRAVSLSADLLVHKVVLQPRRNFPVTHWFYNDALLDWYRLVPFEERYWTILRAYVEDVVRHGQDCLYVPVFTPPLDGVKSPSQLLRVTRRGGGYRFDWSDVKRYTDLARRCGIRYFEWTHLFTQWGVKYALRIYEGQGIGEKLLWPPETAADSPTYRKFLAAFLPELETFLRRERLMDRSFFHVSDEPHGEEHLRNYQRARAIVKELAPWMKTMDALSEIVYGREKVTDLPIPSISVTKQFVDEGIPCCTYFCCGPRGRYLNRLLDTPLAKVQMSGWLFYRFQVLGFLHWGYNYWYRSQTRKLIDPFAESSGEGWPGWAYGDPFEVYPGPEGPIDSIRWEIFHMSLQDYALLQTLGVDPNGKLLSVFRDFDKFPKKLDWWRRARRRLLQSACA